MIINRTGILKVTQIHSKEIYRRDFDAQEWSYEWVTINNGIIILRLLHDRDPDATTSYDFMEFSAPVNIEFEYLDE